MQTQRSAGDQTSKLTALAHEYGFSVVTFIEEYGLEDVVPGICMNPDCEYTTEVEPDQRQGWCGECGTTTVKSGLILAGII
jgi:hypothetical protein